jgi:histidyl-tRNA synthetase
MLAQKYAELVRPLWFMIGNNWREKLNRPRTSSTSWANIFGVEGCLLTLRSSLIVEIMKEFGADEKQFEIRFSDRKLVNTFLLETLKFAPEKVPGIRHLMDRFNKMGKESFVKELVIIGASDSQISGITAFMISDFSTLKKVIQQKILDENDGYKNLKTLIEMLEISGLMKYCVFDPSIIRGFDYSDGLVYEVFDKNPVNRRSIFGGERFDKLINIFGDYDLPATGFALGDWTLKEFLTNWNLLPKYTPPAEYFITLWPSQDNKFLKADLAVADELRKKGKNVLLILFFKTG